jgi:catechol 2,3-dioxygenase-like lactoylglutathione lyase family enzyme
MAFMAVREFDCAVCAQITFLYYAQIEPAAAFYAQTLGFELVEDQGWAKIYRTGGNAYVGLVAGEKGYHRPQAKSAVLVTLVVDDAARWYEKLRGKGVRLLGELEDRAEIGIRCFFFEDPGGYTLEVQEFLKPEQIAVFGGT